MSRDGLERRVLEALAGSRRGPLKSKELAHALKIPTADYRRFKRLLAGLERAGKIHRVRGRYAVASASEVVTGTISLTRGGDGFVRPDGPGEDLFVPSTRLSGARDGDRIVARRDRTPRGRLPEGSVTRVLERARDAIVGVYREGRKLAFVEPLDPRDTGRVLVAPGEDGGAAEGEVVVVRVVTWGDGRVAPSGRIERVLGPPSAPGVDVMAVAYGFGVSMEFPEGVTEAAERSARDLAADAGEGRVDRRELLCFTIDPGDAKDHDDALSVTVQEGGLVEVGVHIADVSHFVPIGGPVDTEALARGTSVYLVDRTIPMLPAVLSNQVCSLEADEDRFAVSVFMALDGEGRVHERRYERTLIRCRHGLAYEDAQAVLDGKGSISPEVDEALRLLDDRARGVRHERAGRGSLDLDVPEAKVVLDAAGSPIDIRRRERLESHRLIEDYMVLANEVVANDLEARDLPTLYRIHEPPSREKVEQLAETLSGFGLRVPRRKSLSPRDMQRILEAAKGRAEESLVSMLVLRSMQKARYHTENAGHFGLASGAYLHFTSPIRRYPDLVVHRVVTEVLIGGGAPPYPDVESLVSVAERSSARERAAEEAERASVALKKVEFMERHLGDVFAGTISGVAPFGMFVTLERYFVEGLVHVRTLGDDYYEYREREHALVAERGRGRHRLGDRVEVQVARVDKEARHIDFELLRKLPGAPRKGN